MKPVILESLYAGDVDRNVLYLRYCIRDCLRRGESPFASHRMFTDALDDKIPEDRELGIAAGLAWREIAEERVFYVDLGWSNGMTKAREMYLAEGRSFCERRLHPDQFLEFLKECAIPSDEPRDGLRLPYATHSGVFRIGDFEFRCHRLSDGMTVLNVEDVERFFSEGRDG